MRQVSSRLARPMILEMVKILLYSPEASRPISLNGSKSTYLAEQLPKNRGCGHVRDQIIVKWSWEHDERMAAFVESSAARESLLRIHGLISDRLYKKISDGQLFKYLEKVPP